MEITGLRDIFLSKEEYLNQEVCVSGWVRSNRDSKNFGFLTISDGTFFTPLQVVYHDEMANFGEIAKLGVGAAVIVSGKLIPTPEAKQEFELQAVEISVEGETQPDYPLQKKRHSLEYLRTIPHLRPRTNTFQAVFRIRSQIAYAIHAFFQERGFVYVHTPLITASDAEGAGEMFEVTTLPLNDVPMKDGGVDYSEDFFGKKTSLTVSGQLNGEAFAQAFRDIYTFGPTFRAEKSNTQRHAAEFWMIEPEMAFADLDDVMFIAEDMLKYIIQYVLVNAPEELEFLNQFVDKGLLERLQHIVKSDFARVSYTEAVEMLEKVNDRFFEYKVKWGSDLQTEHERYLTEEIYKCPVFVTDYPKDIKSFYMKLNEDGKTVAAVDCLVPGIGEIIGGSQREDDLDKLTKRMQELNMNMEDYQFYLDLRKYGSTRHGGFGLGFERAVMYITGMSNIRDVLPFPRTVGNCEL